MGAYLQKNLTLVVGIFSTVTALVGTFESITNLQLVWRLLITGVAALLILIATTNRLSRWVRPDSAVLGFGREEEPASRARVFLGAVGLTLLCAAFVFLAWLQTDRFILKIDESRSAEVFSATLFAPSRIVDTVMVQLPGPDRSYCDWRDLRTNSFPRLRAQMIDWDSPIRKLRVDNFIHPQAVNIECRPPNVISMGIHVRPQSTEVFMANQLRDWQRLIYILGGLIWIAAIWCLFSSQRWAPLSF